MHSTYYGYITVGEGTNTAEVEIADSIRQGWAQRIVSLPQKFKDDPRFEWAQDPNELWRRAGQAEHGSTSVVAHEIRISLNPNLPLEASGRVLREAVQDYVDRNGNTADIIIYSKSVEGEVQYQAAVFQTTRQITPEGFGDRTPSEEERLLESADKSYWEDDILDWFDVELEILEESELSMYENDIEKGEMTISEWMVKRGFDDSDSVDGSKSDAVMPGPPRGWYSDPVTMDLKYLRYISVGEGTNIGEALIADSTRQEVAQRMVFLPLKSKDDPRFAWAQDPNKLWRQAAQAEHDLNAEVARETRFSLNPNLPIEAGGRILEKVMQEYVDENGSAVDIIIYSKPVVDSGIDSPQYQAVVFETTRQITPEGFGDRTPPEEERLQELLASDDEINPTGHLETLRYVELNYRIEKTEASELGSMYDTDPEKGEMTFSEWMVKRGFDDSGSLAEPEGNDDITGFEDDEEERTFPNGAFYGRIFPADGSHVDLARFEKIISSAPTDGLADIPEYAKVELHVSNDRYLAFMGLLVGHHIPEELTLDDRKKYAHLYEETPEGEPLVSDKNEIEFMHQVSGLPREWCAAWTYGEAVELVAAGIMKGDPDELIQGSYQSALQATADARKQQLVDLGYSVDELMTRSREQAEEAMLKMRESSRGQGPAREGPSDDNER